eukprot:TRINITY_DN16825_c0_g3_i3.p1 TRINITY_DN16825_c0_g3~~TRINITY_DN16825_c0_g3_i3.p1  ORF type:complete len:699 (+),score=18.30 TRINITY_DN16825_c0_g3_i3:121-2217(+)
MPSPLPGRIVAHVCAVGVGLLIILGGLWRASIARRKAGLLGGLAAAHAPRANASAAEPPPASTPPTPPAPPPPTPPPAAVPPQPGAAPKPTPLPVASRGWAGWLAPCKTNATVSAPSPTPPPAPRRPLPLSGDAGIGGREHTIRLQCPAQVAAKRAAPPASSGQPAEMPPRPPGAWAAGQYEKYDYGPWNASTYPDPIPLGFVSGRLAMEPPQRPPPGNLPPAPPGGDSWQDPFSVCQHGCLFRGRWQTVSFGTGGEGPPPGRARGKRGTPPWLAKKLQKEARARARRMHPREAWSEWHPQCRVPPFPGREQATRCLAWAAGMDNDSNTGPFNISRYPYPVPLAVLSTELAAEPHPRPQPGNAPPGPPEGDSWHDPFSYCLPGCLFRGQWTPVHFGTGGEKSYARVRGRRDQLKALARARRMEALRQARNRHPREAWSEWYPQCKLHSFPGKEAALRCLAGKTILLVGDSKDRAFFYEFLTLFTGEIVGRQNQKAVCQQFCSAWFAGGIHVVYIAANPNFAWCPSATCAAKHGAPAGGVVQGWWDLARDLGLRPDILVSGLGWHQPLTMSPESLPVVQADIRRLACALEHIQRGGTDVYHRGYTPTWTWPGSTHVLFKNLELINDFNSKWMFMRKELDGLLRDAGVRVLDEGSLLATALEQNVGHAVYTDHVHAPAASYAAMRMMLASHCARHPPSAK